jgi:hypothetical protein
VVSSVVDTVLRLHGPPAYALVGGLAFAEAALFVGFVLPGETAVLLGGVLAHEHRVSSRLSRPWRCWRRSSATASATRSADTSAPGC